MSLPKVSYHLSNNKTAQCKRGIEWLLVGMAGTEAMEHNAIVGGTLRRIGDEVIKPMLSSRQWDELVSELDWFEHPMSEFTANIAVLGCLSELEKMGLDVSRARELRRLGWEYNEKGISGAAQARYIELKDELVSLAKKLCDLLEKK